MVVEHNRIQLGNPDLRRRLEKDWKRWPDPMLLSYLGVVLALGVMVLMVTRIDMHDRERTIILAPSEAPPALVESALSTNTVADVWIEPGIAASAAPAARQATAEEHKLVLRRLAGAVPVDARLVIARVGEEVVRLDLSAAEARPQTSPGE